MPVLFPFPVFVAVVAIALAAFSVPFPSICAVSIPFSISLHSLSVPPIRPKTATACIPLPLSIFSPFFLFLLLFLLTCLTHLFIRLAQFEVAIFNKDKKKLSIYACFTYKEIVMVDHNCGGPLVTVNDHTQLSCHKTAMYKHCCFNICINIWRISFFTQLKKNSKVTSHITNIKSLCNKQQKL